jgi:outer membrane protein
MENSMKTSRSFLAAALGVALVVPAFQASAEGFTARIGFANVDPKSDNGRLAGAYDVEVGSDTSFNLGLAWFATDNIAIDFSTALAKYEHDLSLTGGATGLPTLNNANLVGVEHRPTVLQVQYHFAPGSQFSPYIGGGYSWTQVDVVRNQTGLGVIAADDANGFAAEGGIDFNFGENLFARASVQYLTFETDVTLGGAAIGTVDVNPWVFGLAAGIRF